MDNLDLRKKIVDELRKINYNLSYLGTEYLIDTIYFLIKYQKTYSYNLEKEIYPDIAKKYDTNVSNLKNNIRNATDKMYYDCEELKLEEYMGYSLKPTPKRVIKVVLKKVS